MLVARTSKIITTMHAGAAQPQGVSREVAFLRLACSRDDRASIRDDISKIIESQEIDSPVAPLHLSLKIHASNAIVSETLTEGAPF